MVACNMRRTILCFVCVSFLFGTTSVNAGFWNGISTSARWIGNRVTQSSAGGVIAGGTRWLSGQAVEFGTYWALNTNIADRFGKVAQAFSPGTYSRWYTQKLDALQGVFSRHQGTLGIMSPVASLLLAGYGGLPLAIAQQVGATCISGALSSLLYRRQSSAPNRLQRAPISRAQLVSEGASVNRSHVQNASPLVAGLPASSDDADNLSEVLWLLARHILGLTCSAMVMHGAQALGNCVCPLLGSNEWQYIINYAALKLYGVASDKLFGAIGAPAVAA